MAASTATAGTFLLPKPAFASFSQPTLNFLVIGDWGRRGSDYQRHVARQMGIEAASASSKFIVSTGDNFYKWGVSSTKDSHWSQSFDCIYTDDSLQKCWYPVLGNHDYGGNIDAQIKRTSLCHRWHMPERWHKISGSDYGRSDLDLFFIDTIVWRGKENFPFSVLGSKVDPHDQEIQKRWLAEALSASKADFKLVFGHYPIYSIGPHGGDKSMDDLDRLLIQNNVTAYINGHDHCLYHIQSPEMDYICSGGGSQELTKFTGDLRTYGCVIPNQCTDDAKLPRWKSFVDRAGFASFSLGEQSIQFKLIDRFGVVFHTQTLRKRVAAGIVA